MVSDEAISFAAALRRSHPSPQAPKTRPAIALVFIHAGAQADNRYDIARDRRLKIQSLKKKWALPTLSL
ncbi:MAG: hypothetical protein KME06_02470 [Kastovskya adunca ATA6-11-RM4]|nr:hypothetical protein [Kastovskya adunca ATA6-11-RM4]